MLSLQNAGKRFGPRVLFLEANWLIRAREKTALVGANGTGKSTIMKVLCEMCIRDSIMAEPENNASYNKSRRK